MRARAESTETFNNNALISLLHIIRIRLSSFFFFLPWCLRKYILVYRRRNLCAYYIFAAFHLLLLNLSPDTGDKSQMILDSTETSFIHLKKKISYEVKKVAAWKSWKCSKYLPPIVIQTTNSTLLHFWTTAFARRHFFSYSFIFFLTTHRN